LVAGGAVVVAGVIRGIWPFWGEEEQELGRRGVSRVTRGWRGPRARAGGRYIKRLGRRGRPG